MAHKYPKDLVFELLALWREKEAEGKSFRLPDFEVLLDLVSTCYQVSQMQEEARELRFRLMLCEPDDIDRNGDFTRLGLFTLSFAQPRPYNEYELLKLGPSIDYNNSLIGVRYSRSEGLQIWGFIHSGSRWTHVIHGGSKQATPLPAALGLNVIGSGRLLVCRGLEILAQLGGGTITSPTTNVFQSQWMAKHFMRLQQQITRQHGFSRDNGSGSWARIDPEFLPTLYMEFFKHLISTVRRSGHGGTIISLPLDNKGVAGLEPLVDLRYRFPVEGECYQLRSIVLEILEMLVRKCGRLYGPDYHAGWKDYVSMQTEELALLDERLFKFARFVARLTGIDGAVFTNEGLELIGFGGIIQGTMEMSGSVAKALDLEGEMREVERLESVGTRHRSIYYLCNRLPNILAIIISQDAKAQLVTWKGDMVTCWDVVPIDFA